MLKKNFLHALLRVPAVTHPLVSPDGKLVAWSWERKDRRANVYVCRTDGDGRPLRLTDCADDVLPVSWAADSKRLIVGTCEDGNERVQLLLLHTEAPGRVQELTAAHPPYYTRGGHLHHKNRYLVCGINYDFVAGCEIDASAVYRLDLKTGERKLLALPQRSPEYSLNAPQLNAQGTHVLYFRADKNACGQQVHIVDINGRYDRQVIDVGDDCRVTACWMPDGVRVLFVADAAHYRRLGMYDSRRRRYKWLINDAQRNIEHAFPVARAADQVVVVEVKNACERCFVLDTNTLCESHVLPRDDGATLLPLAPTDDGHWVGVLYDSTHACDLVSFSLPRGGCLSGFCQLPHGAQRVKTRSLIRRRGRRDVPAGYSRKRLVPARDFFWRSVDGLNLHGFVYQVKKPRATIVLVHGGPRDRCEPIFDPLVQYLVSQRFNVFQPNYRGSTGYGLSFQEAIKAEGWGGIEQEDIRTGIEALIKEGLARPGNIGMMGTSYGGYSSWHAVTHWPRRLVAAAAPICGMTDLAVDYRTTRGDLRTLSEAMMGGTPDQVPEKYAQRSPINFVRNIKARLLIVQGLQDPNVTPENLRQVRRALKAAGIRHQVLTFDDEGHGIHKRENQLELFTRLARFFKESLSG